MASKNITMVDSGLWVGFDKVDGYDGEDSFDNILNMLDFPMESLEVGDCLAEDWDDAKFQCLGPIPSALCLVPYPADANEKPPPLLNARTSQMNQQPTFIKVSNAIAPLDSSDCNESGVFQASSPISMLESSSSSSAGKSISLGADIAIPVRSRSKRVRRPTCNPWFVMTPLTSSSKDWQPRKNKEKKRKRISQIRASHKGLEGNATPQQRSTSVTKKCTHCEITKTPQWREGPMGPKTLCNACGVRFRSGRLFPEYRPAASPTFVPCLHSNSHRKVIEMRKKVSTPDETTKMEPPMSPPPEFVPMSSYLFDHM